eukprot:4063322-Amphidinium_carterae.1
MSRIDSCVCVCVCTCVRACVFSQYPNYGWNCAERNIIVRCCRNNCSDITRCVLPLEVFSPNRRMKLLNHEVQFKSAAKAVTSYGYTWAARKSSNLKMRLLLSRSGCAHSLVDH